MPATIARHPATSSRLIRSLKMKTVDAKVNSILIWATVFQTAAFYSVIAVNQPKDAEPQPNPTAWAGFHAAAMRRNSAGSRSAIHTIITMVWNVIAAQSVTPPCIRKLGPPSDSDAPR